MRDKTDDLKAREAFYSKEISIRGFPLQFLTWITRDGLYAEYSLREYIRDFGFYETAVSPEEYSNLVEKLEPTNACCKKRILMLLWAFYIEEV